MVQQGNRLLLEGVYNLREVRGYAASNGRRWAIRPRALLRADCLHRLPPSSQQALVDYGLRTIVDLRRQIEVEYEPNVFAQSGTVAYHNIALYSDWQELGPERPDDLLHLYQLILDQCQPTLRDLFAIAARPRAFPLLVHCKVGKDRTGIVIALLLALAGVPPELIAADYAQSRANLEPLMLELREEASRFGYDMTYYETLLPSDPETMLQMLAYLEAKYGGSRGYLRQIGLQEAQLDQILQQLVVEE